MFQSWRQENHVWKMMKKDFWRKTYEVRNTKTNLLTFQTFLSALTERKALFDFTMCLYDVHYQRNTFRTLILKTSTQIFRLDDYDPDIFTSIFVFRGIVIQITYGINKGSTSWSRIFVYRVRINEEAINANSLKR